MRLVRTRLTWYAYLLSGFFTFIISIQGNIIPFLRDELNLSYAAVSLHPSALAAGMMATGLFTQRVVAAHRPALDLFARGGRLHRRAAGGLFCRATPPPASPAARSSD